MISQVELGIHGITVGLGDHICGLYAGARQRDELVIPFLEAGLRRGDKCICVVDGVEPAEIVDDPAAVTTRIITAASDEPM